MVLKIEQVTERVESKILGEIPPGVVVLCILWELLFTGIDVTVCILAKALVGVLGREKDGSRRCWDSWRKSGIKIDCLV